jgi:hypothetical protein
MFNFDYNGTHANNCQLFFLWIGFTFDAKVKKTVQAIYVIHKQMPTFLCTYALHVLHLHGKYLVEEEGCTNSSVRNLEEIISVIRTVGPCHGAAWKMT